MQLEDTPPQATDHARRQHFASDNYAGMCPEAAHWFNAANGSGHALVLFLRELSLSF
jgi:hypothetical protein